MLSRLFSVVFRRSRRQHAFNAAFRGVCLLVMSGYILFMSRNRFLPLAEVERLEAKQNLAASTLRIANVFVGMSAVFLILGLCLLGAAWWHLKLAKGEAESGEPVAPWSW